MLSLAPSLPLLGFMDLAGLMWMFVHAILLGVLAFVFLVGSVLVTVIRPSSPSSRGFSWRVRGVAMIRTSFVMTVPIAGAWWALNGQSRAWRNELDAVAVGWGVGFAVVAVVVFALFARRERRKATDDSKPPSFGSRGSMDLSP